MPTANVIMAEVYKKSNGDPIGIITSTPDGYHSYDADGRPDNNFTAGMLAAYAHDWLEKHFDELRGKPHPFAFQLYEALKSGQTDGRSVEVRVVQQ